MLVRAINSPTLVQVSRWRSPTRSLVGAWAMNAGGGTTLHDYSGRGQDGTFDDTKILWGISEYNRTLTFDLVEHGTINLGSTPWGIAEGFTIGVLVKPTTGTGGAQRRYISSDRFSLYQTAATGVGLTRYNAAGAQVADFTAAFNMLDGWFHLVIATFSITWGSLIYIDGLAINGNSTKTANGDQGTTRIGGSHVVYADYAWHGQMPMAFIANRAYDPYEINLLVKDPYLLFRPSPAAQPGAPSGTTTVQLDWTDVSEHEDGFSIERAEDAGAFAEIDTVAADVETYDDLALPTGHTYHYRVRAISAALGYSEYSNEADVVV